MTQCTTTNTGGHLGVMWKTVSEDCNLACDYCYYSRVGGKLGHRVKTIDSKVLEKFIREYMGFSNGLAPFAWQGGEPLLAGLEFFEEVVYLQAKYAPPNTAISNTIQTNATLITEDWARFFKKYNFLVGVSLDGPEEIHDRRRVTHSGAGSYRRTIRGIEYLRQYEVDFNILTVVHDKNVHEAKRLMQFYAEMQFQYVQFIPCMDFRAQEVNKPPKYLITPEQYGDFLCEAFDCWYKDGHPDTSIRFFDNMLNVYLNHEAELCVHRRSCPTTLILEQNGDAYPCDFYIGEDYKVGNVGTDSLTDILGNYVYHNFLQKKPALPEKCQKCEFQNLCYGGCPRNRIWHEDGNSDPDYFCEGYLKIYSYAHERMIALAKNIRVERLRGFLRSGGKEPGRNDPCFCGSGVKYKKCCEVVRNEI